LAFTLDTRNVRTLPDHSRADKPERRTALVARQLARYNVDIAALSETRLADQVRLTEIRCGYIFFWSGRGVTERRESGVGFTVKSHMLRKLTKLPVGHSDRLRSLQLPLSKGRNATLIGVYAPPMTLF